MAGIKVTNVMICEVCVVCNTDSDMARAAADYINNEIITADRRIARVQKEQELYSYISFAQERIAECDDYIAAQLEVVVEIRGHEYKCED